MRRFPNGEVRRMGSQSVCKEGQDADAYREVNNQAKAYEDQIGTLTH